MSARIFLAGFEQNISGRMSGMLVILVAVCCLLLAVALAAGLYLHSKSTGTPAAAGTATAVAAAPPGEVPKVPDWAVLGTVLPSGLAQMPVNKKLVDAANASKTGYDLVMWGDSITAMLADSASQKVWKKHFGDIKAAHLGVSGNTLEQLAWRIMVGERFAVDPRCAVILIGINNFNKSQGDVNRMEFLLKWMRAAMPKTKVIVLNILPNAKGLDTRAANENYKKYAAAHGATFSTCGADLDPRNTALVPDGVHLTAAGYERLLGCLKPLVTEALK